MLSSRQIGMVQLLHDREGYTTMNQLSGTFHVSVRTVRNDLESMKEYFERQKCGRLETKPHAGVRVHFSDEEWEEMSRQLEGGTLDISLETDIRQTVIRLLLKHGEVSFIELEKRLYTGRNTLEKALPGVKNWFMDHDILYEKKRGKGMEISCTELNWRLAMWHFFHDSKKNIQTAQGRDMFSEDVIQARLLDGFDVYGVAKAVNGLEEEFDLVFGYEAHMQMVFLISLGIMRSRKRCFVEMPPLEPCKVDSVYDVKLAGVLSEDLERYYQIVCTPEERDYILFVIRIADIQRFTAQEAGEDFQIQNLDLCILTMKLTNLMGEIISVDLKSDQFFIECLLIQLRSTVQRLKYHISCPHPLLKQVKQKYPNIFAAVYAAGVFFDKELGVEINENEMCSLALLLGGALERNIAVLTACVVCNYGIGVSQLLKERIERNITDLKILEVFSIRDMRKIRNLSCDFIISAVPIKEPCGGKEVVVVEHLLPAYDVKKIGDKMKEIRKGKLKNRTSINSLRLQRELFHQEFIWIGMEAEDKDSAIRRMCKELADSGYVTEHFERSVFEHEEKAPTGLEHGVAIPHGFAKYVIRPIAAYARLKEPVVWQDGEPADMIFLLAFNMDEVSGLKEETIQFYSVFLDMLDNDEELKRVRDIQKADEMAEYMNHKIRGDRNL